LLAAAPGRERSAFPAGEAALLTQLRLSASDDYELLLAIDPAAWPGISAAAERAGVPLTAIGEASAARGMRLRDAGGIARPLEAGGWDHFAWP
ncbi:MAG TPA: thiamine-phosphate kinase, partial [Candidatus Eisenbacteria bacterium]